METEYEVRFLDINIEGIENKLKKIGAKKRYDNPFKIRAFFANGDDDKDFIRIRDEGDKITLCHKKTQTGSIVAEEYEIEVDDFEKAHEFLKSLNYREKVYAEKRRIHYVLDNFSIDIDIWPLIPPFVEIEGEDEEHIKQICQRLDFDYNDAHKGDAFDVYREYGIEPNRYKILSLDKQVLK